MKAYGTRATFRILGVAAFGTATFYFCFNQLYIIPMHRRQEREKKVTPVHQVAVKENVPDKEEKEDKGHVNEAFSPEKTINSVE